MSAAPTATPTPTVAATTASPPPPPEHKLDVSSFASTVSQGGAKIINKMKKALEEKRVFYSFEYFPPKTPEGVKNLFDRLDRMSTLDPMFMDVTWNAGGVTGDLTLEISSALQNFCSSEVMMHLTCTNMPAEKITNALAVCKKNGIRNILALRGDPPRGAEKWEACENGFSYAVDLVKHIRKEHGDYFGIAVAGYPEGHPSGTNLDDDIKYLKAKVDAGADFVITQLFYDVDKFLDWIKKCRAAGITCPIIPGIMPILDYGGFKRMTGFCKTAVPKAIEETLETIKNDEARVKAYGIEVATQMCRRLLEAGLPGLHFYTLNLERSVVCILEALGYVVQTKAQQMPWKLVGEALVSRRAKEEVRPIFWANRPKSYLYRTSAWDDFPNGRWGDSQSPAFGELSDYHLCTFKTGSADERKKLWGVPTTPKEVFEVFGKYIEGEIARLPWCEDQLLLETLPLKKALKKLNQYGFLTINSQPRVNGEPSSDAAVGWGGPGGYVYQKAYIEFFTSPQNLEKLAQVAATYPSLSYTAVDTKGKTVTNRKFDQQKSVTAVTWGVFPDREIIQPTIVDSSAFLVWKDEAFALWKSQWQSIYPKESASYDLIQEIHDTYYLVNIIDNDFVKGDIFAFFDRVVA